MTFADAMREEDRKLIETEIMQKILKSDLGLTKEQILKALKS